MLAPPPPDDPAGRPDSERLARGGLSTPAKLLLWIAGIVGLLFAGIVVLVVAMASRIPSKASYPHADSAPRSAPVSAEPILQLENHTCGFLSLAAAYTKYGLSPEDENLRFRLGVDRPANPLDGSTTGTLHPDLFRVLKQDHFDYWLIDPGSEDTPSALREHFSSGNAVLLLISRRENGNLHWVMSDAFHDQELRIVDSLREVAYTEPANAFIRRHVLSIIAIRPARTDSPLDLKPHADGLAELAEVRSRLAEQAPRQ